MRDKALSLLLFLLVSSVYYATAAGITSSNDGSSYALVRAIVEEHRFEIDSFYSFTENIDAALRSGKIYSDRAPGTALLAAPAYAVGGYLPRPIVDLPSRHDYGNPRLAYLMMLSALVGAGMVVLLYRFLRSYELSIFASMTASLAFAFGTTNWKYCSTLFTHGLSGFFVLTGVMLAVHVTRTGRLGLPSAWLLGLVLGASILVEYSNILFVAVVLVYLVSTLKSALFRLHNWWMGVMSLAAGFFLPVGFLLWYNTLNFGGPFTTSYAFNIGFPWATRLTTTFSFPLVQGLIGMLWTGRDSNGLNNQGLFLLMPITIVALGGMWSYFKHYRGEATLILGIFTLYVLLFSTHRTFAGGNTADGRYLSPFLVLLLIPVGFALERLHLYSQDTFSRSFALTTVYGLFFLSIRNIFVHIAFSNNRFFPLEHWEPRAASLSNWSYVLGTVFVNWKNLPLLWIVEISVMVLLGGGWWLRRSLASQITTPSIGGASYLRQVLALAAIGLSSVVVISGLLLYFRPTYETYSIPSVGARVLSLRYEDVAELVSVEPALVRAQPGGAAHVALTWRAIQPTEDELMVYLHSLEGTLVRFDDWPGHGELPSTSWTPGQTWTENYIIVIPPDAERQVVSPLVSGLYDPKSARNLRAADNDGNEVIPLIGQITINGPVQSFKPDYRLGGIIGLANPEITIQDGNWLVCLRWVSLAPTTEDYHIFVHLLSDEGEIISQTDTQPKNGSYPTSVWVAGEVIEDCVSLSMTGAEVSSGKIAIGLYEFSSGKRLPIMDSDGVLLPDDMLVITP